MNQNAHEIASLERALVARRGMSGVDIAATTRGLFGGWGLLATVPALVTNAAIGFAAGVGTKSWKAGLGTFLGLGLVEYVGVLIYEDNRERRVEEYARTSRAAMAERFASAPRATLRSDGDCATAAAVVGGSVPARCYDCPSGMHPVNVALMTGGHVPDMRCFPTVTSPLPRPA